MSNAGGGGSLKNGCDFYFSKETSKCFRKFKRIENCWLIEKNFQKKGKG